MQTSQEPVQTST